MPPAPLVRLSPSLVATLVAHAVLAQGGGLRTAGGGAHFPRSRVKSRVLPFPSLARSAPFVVLPSRARFIEMAAIAADLGPGAAPGLKRPATAYQLVYGYRKGGIGCVYEMPIQPNLDALTVFQATLKSGIFKDRQYFKEWSIKAVADKRLLIAVSGTTPEVRDALVRAIGK